MKPDPKPALECDLKRPEFCDGLDVRPVIRRRIHLGKPYYDGPKGNWCKGCRVFMGGMFKFDR